MRRSAERQNQAPSFVSVHADEVAKKMAREDPAVSLIGRQIGCYQILTKLGEGGMGEVYRARDSKLGRDVAIKVLPSALTRDPDRLARFGREARLLAALNHPHVAAIYGLEDSEDLQALVLELVEGPTLADRIAQGPLSIKETLTVAGQIADALEAAHEKGIVHRDLKPANIKLTNDGNVKVLDFGLAKMGAGEVVEADEADTSLSDPPTITLEATEAGIILGTAAYMSPEQARGHVVDKRSDIWAFGCVLFELLTGRKVFPGDTVADTFAAILEKSPDWAALPAETPASIIRLLHRCLEKDRKRRQRDIGDVRIEIEEAAAALLSPATSEPHRVQATHDRIVAAQRRAHVARWAAGAVCVLAIGAVAVRWYIKRPKPVPPNPLEGATFTRLTDFEGAEEHAAISRDGKFVAFLSDRDGAWDIWVSQVGTGDFHNLTKGSEQEFRMTEARTINFSPDGSLLILWRRRPDGTVDGGWAVPTMGGPLRPYLTDASELDWSPDGSRIVYHPSTGGDPLFVTEAGEKSGHKIHSSQEGVHNHFPTWSPDGDFIYFVQGFPPHEMDIWRIRPTGGEPEQLTIHNARVSFPTFLDNRRLLYLTTAEDGSGPWIHELDVERRVTRRISTGVEEYESLASSADGRRLVATVSGSVAGLWRVPIAGRVVHESDATRLALPTTQGLSPRIGNGFVLYRAPKAGTHALWMVKEGTATELWNGADGPVVAGPAIAPDGRSVAFPVQKKGLTLTRLYVTNADGTGARRLAEELDVRGAPAWSPDGKWIAIAAIQEGEPRLYKIPVDGGTPVRLTEEYSLDPLWSPSNRYLVYSGANVGAAFLVKAVTPEGAPHDMPKILLSRECRRMGLLASGDELVVRKGEIFKDFWVVDLRNGRERQLTDLGRGFTVEDFDVSADGREIIFDRAKDESDIVLIDLAPH